MTLTTSLYDLAQSLAALHVVWEKKINYLWLGNIVLWLDLHKYNQHPHAPAKHDTPLQGNLWEVLTTQF